MNRTMFLFFLVTVCSYALPQVSTGSVVFIDFSNDEITVAADSRTNDEMAGVHFDNECKISVLGNRFVFAVTGFAQRADYLPSGSLKPVWSAQAEARTAFEGAFTIHSNVDELTSDTAKKWTQAVEKDIENSRSIFPGIRRQLDQRGIVTSGFFATTDQTHRFSARSANIIVDVAKYDATGEIKLNAESDEIMRPNSWGYSGFYEIMREFSSESTPRAQEYMKWFRSQIENLSPSERRAAIASKMIELSILLHPQRELLGFPVDVVQLDAGEDARWVSRKPSCAEN